MRHVSTSELLNQSVETTTEVMEQVGAGRWNINTQCHHGLPRWIIGRGKLRAQQTSLQCTAKDDA